MLRYLTCLVVVIVCASHASAEPVRFEYRYHQVTTQTPIANVSPYPYLELVHVDGPETSSAELGVPTPLRSLILRRGGPTPTGTNPLISIFDTDSRIADLASGEQVSFYLANRLTGTLVGTTGSTAYLEFLGPQRPIRVGDHLYRIRYDSVDVPSWDALSEPLLIHGDLTVTQVPEPTTLALATLGVAGCWWVRRRGSRPRSRESLPS
jgi:hypothetical protein